MRACAAAAGCAAALAALTALPAAAAAPPSDDRGYIDSTARCASPDTAVVFGTTGDSRVAICRSPGGAYEYRGVRVRDGARLVLPATSSGGGVFVADNDGIEYMVTSKELVISSGSKVLRDEPWVDFHGAGDMPSSTSSTPSTPSSTSPSNPTAEPEPPSDPLPAEVGGSGS